MEITDVVKQEVKTLPEGVQPYIGKSIVISQFALDYTQLIRFSFEPKYYISSSTSDDPEEIAEEADYTMKDQEPYNFSRMFGLKPEDAENLLKTDSIDGLTLGLIEVGNLLVVEMDPEKEKRKYDIIGEIRSIE